ncbi:MAG: FtsW/RodA/SpoVE family cell cycle protein [Dethiobacteria bacterium]
MNEYLTGLTGLFASVGNFLARFELAMGLYTLVVRWVFPILALIIFWRCMHPLLQNTKGDRLWGYLSTTDGVRVPLQHWENLIGRSRFADIVINFPFISRLHAVLKYRNGGWFITDLASKGGVKVNGAKVKKEGKVNYGDTISLAGVKMVLIPAGKDPGTGLPDGMSPKDDPLAPQGFGTQGGDGGATPPFGRQAGTSAPRTLLLVIIFQILGSIQIFISMGARVNPGLPLALLFLILAECLHYFIVSRYSQKHFELELLCYFLCGLNLLLIASAAPDSLLKQLLAILLGLATYLILGVLLRDPELAGRLKLLFMVFAFGLLVLNLTIGETHFGSKNWINLGFVTFQPMEFVKIAFVMAGTATLDKLLTTRDMTAFIVFSGACILTLALIRDFGTAVVFFGAFIVMAFLYSGDLRTIAFLVIAGALLGGGAIFSLMPYVASRFATWGRAWEFVNTSGYQQTRTMIAAASGGLLGVGGGNGYMVNIPAADTDLVFGILCEEWGLLLALIAVLMLVFIALHLIFLLNNCRSSFYAIAACGAATIFLIQTILNVLGSVDILPLTGITLPFLSRGGSSMVASWGLLAFIKAVDERPRPKLRFPFSWRKVEETTANVGEGGYDKGGRARK